MSSQAVRARWAVVRRPIAGFQARNRQLSRLRSRSHLHVPILRGRLAGTRWLPAAGGKTLRVLLGTYEPEQTALFGRLTATGATVFDVGAHVGYYTLLASALVGPAGRVAAFEPDPDNLRFLRAHVEVNRRSNITVIGAAVGECTGEALFEAGTGSGTGHLAGGVGHAAAAAAPVAGAAAGSAGAAIQSVNAGAGAAAGIRIRVPVISLDEFVAARDCVPDVLKIDVEGAEEMVLRGADRLLAERGPVIFLSTHGPDVHRECCRLLAAKGYRLEPITGTGVETATELLCRRDQGSAGRHPGRR